jgi:hypothetical protein
VLAEGVAGPAMSDESAMPVSGDDVEGFVGKWRARWPEWPLAEVFVAPAQRPVALAWAALQQELLDAAWGGRDARPGELKLAWWMEELQGWTQGRRRHPLGRVLQRAAAPWATLAAALPALGRSRERPLDADDAFASMESVAEAAARVELALFGGDEGASSSRLIAATWLATRARGEDGDASVPLALLGREDEGGRARASWRAELRSRWPDAERGVPRIRRLWATLARLRLAEPGDRAPGALRVLWQAWRAARN